MATTECPSCGMPGVYLRRFHATYMTEEPYEDDACRFCLHLGANRPGTDLWLRGLARIANELMRAIEEGRSDG